MNTANPAGARNTPEGHFPRPGLRRRLAALYAGFNAALRALRASNTPR
ncbi:hypothetical protein [Aromatoleum diolicum]|uniref:MarR family transcriptional regulator n=1 Tax=Aromatoleum diolicum TaxID=75796 RepID=A0ABX1QFI9_9RHOO|nr:hypothetical protein [Aromatoleum diolicum]NMG77169.1 hypothetical protein [Aromatoleum diolicum]